MKVLRDYQRAALDDLWEGLLSREGHPLVDAPVSAGKSLLIAQFIKEIHERFPNTKIMMLTHVKELLEQNSAELMSQYPNCDMGFYCAGLGQKKIHNDITFASIQSIGKKSSIIPRPIGVIIIDEAHLVSHKDDTLYRSFIKKCIQRNPKLKVVGFSGTVFRSDTGKLNKGENSLFDYVAHEIPMSYMIEEGWWAKPVSPKTKFKIDRSGLRMSGDEFVSKQVQEIVDDSDIVDNCVRELIETGKDRKKWLLFTAGIKHAEDVTQKLRDYGVSAECVHSDNEDDSSVLRRHKAGEFRVLVNVAKLTTGYNDPGIDLLGILSPINSPVLYVQIIGRGVRPVYADGYDLSTKEGRLDSIYNSPKPNVLVVDFGGVVESLGPVDQVSVDKVYGGEPEESNGGGEAPTKTCPNCEIECGASQRYCYNCSYCFIQLSENASTEAVVSVDIEPEWISVLDMAIDPHDKKGSFKSAKISYYTMSGIIREWVCFEHHNYEKGNNKRFAWDQAVKWHKKRMGDSVECPTLVSEAMALNYPKPNRILARKDGQYWRVIDAEFGEVKEVKEPSFSNYVLDEDEIPF